MQALACATSGLADRPRAQTTRSKGGRHSLRFHPSVLTLSLLDAKGKWMSVSVSTVVYGPCPLAALRILPAALDGASHRDAQARNHPLPITRVEFSTDRVLIS